MWQNSKSGWQGIEPAKAYKQAGRLRDLLSRAEDAIASQQEVIAAQGASSAWTSSLNALQKDRDRLAHDLADLLRHRDHESVLFSLDGPRYVHHLAGARQLANVLASLGDLYLRVGQSTVGRSRLHVPPGMKALFGMKVDAGFISGSFGMRLIVDTQSDLVNDEPRRAALQRLLLLTAASDLTTAAADHGTWTIKKYRELVRRLLEAEATPKMTWRTPYADEQVDLQVGEGALRVLDNRLAQLREGELVVDTAEGTLVEASLVRHTFGVAAHGKVIKGRMSPKLSPQVVTLFGQPVRCRYEERRVLDTSTDQERKFVTLMGIEACWPPTSA